MTINNDDKAQDKSKETKNKEEVNKYVPELQSVRNHFALSQSMLAQL